MAIFRPKGVVLQEASLTSARCGCLHLRHAPCHACQGERQGNRTCRHGAGRTDRAFVQRASPDTDMGPRQGTGRKVLADHKISLTKIQSLPIVGRPWKYAFFVDVIFKQPDDFFDAMDALQAKVKELKLVGTYTSNKENIPSKLTNVLNNGE